MKIISFREAMLRANFTKHGHALLEIVRRQPGIELETLVRDHDPAPLRPIAVLDPLDPLAPKKAIRRFPSGGYAVKQLCDAGVLVITEDLRVYHPQDLPAGGRPEGPDAPSPQESRESESAPPTEAAEGRRASA